MLDTHFNFGIHASDCVERDSISRALNVMKALDGSSWGFTTETLVATYMARRLLQGRMIKETIRSQAPNKMFLPPPRQIDQPNNCYSKIFFKLALGAFQ